MRVTGTLDDPNILALRKRAEALSTLLLGKMNREQKLMLWDMLRKLDNFHAETLVEFPEESVEGIVKHKLA